ncbi:hypothetical protein IHV25_08595 [Phaeovibrio sulfidiphilus]|uniref:Secreted protein n=1 Tax=Phaeovibrio sulfidiphilus TaxID=1220600 RepID=A0A8J6YPQ4_9PROT|nr:hypothetical protein [Phaeovibrio sulfidiphilus]MBE1237704.1 hypothetical protein [Phaeovibrio sulfidiphilus]
MLRAFVVVIALACAQPVASAAAWAAEPPSAEAFALLDSVPDRLEACNTAGILDEAGDQAAVLKALQKDIACLVGLAGEISQTFYPSDAFGRGRGGSLSAALERVNAELLPVYVGVQTKPLACAPNCDAFYLRQAYDMNVRFLNVFILDMIERLKDDSPIHTE